jgi:hypothetical protein
MRNYLAKIKIPVDLLDKSTGKIGEEIFNLWFNRNFEDEKVFNQLADRDYQQIDFACEKGITYQVKTTKAKTYTFNSQINSILDYLNADRYVFIQIKDKYAYIENIYKKEYILNNAKKSFKESNQFFVYCKNLLQYKLEI